MNEKRDVDNIGDVTLPPLKRQPGFFQAFVRVRVTLSTADAFGLNDPNVLRIDNVNWIRENSKYNSYLFYIAALLFDTNDVCILRTKDGRDDSDEATTWDKINPKTEIEGGVYLLQLTGNLTQGLFLHSFRGCKIEH